MMATITEVIQVSRRLVQVILRASARTSRKNCARLVRFFGGGLRERGRRRHDARPSWPRRFRIADGLVPGFLAMGALRTLL